MSYGKPEQICSGERPGYRRVLKQKTTKWRRLKARREMRLALFGSEACELLHPLGKVPMLGWSI